MACSRALRLAAKFRAAQAGMAAVEFAMVLPVMVLMYLGMTELTFGVNTNRKLILLSRTIADLTGRATSVNTTEMNTIFDAALAVMTPYKADTAKMVISSIVVRDTGTKDADGNAVVEGKVCWSDARQGGTALAKNAVVSVPEGFRTPNSSFIRADVKMSYAPVFGSSILQMVTNRSSLTFEEQTPWPVRNVREVTWQGTPACLT